MAAFCIKRAFGVKVVRKRWIKDKSVSFQTYPSTYNLMQEIILSQNCFKKKFSDFNMNFQFLKNKVVFFYYEVIFTLQLFFPSVENIGFFYLPCNLNSFKPISKLWLAYVALYIKCVKICSA